jgi:niacin transporter
MTAVGLINDIAYTQISIKTKKAVLGQVLFLTLALLLPTITHRLGLNFLVAQPMHWMILFAGLTYGPLSGLIIGASLPVISFLVSGMPMPMMLPLMIPELAVYGFLAGLLKQKTTAFGSLAIALIAGRLLFLALFASLGRLNVPVFEFMQSTWMPGLFAVLLQITLLPLLSGLYINWIKDKN